MPPPRSNAMRYRSLLAAALVAGVLIACRGKESKTEGGAADQNRIVMAVKSSPTNLDVRVGNDNVSGRFFDVIYSGLIKVTPEMDYAPDVATRWETTDERTIIFDPISAVVFQEGRPGPDDVV